MITEHDLAEAIAECEGQRNPTANTCLKLAAFYTIRDKMYPHYDGPKFYSTASKEQKVEHAKDESEFRKAIAGRTMDDLIDIMDEVMSTLEVISPKLYAGIMRKLTNII